MFLVALPKFSLFLWESEFSKILTWIADVNCPGIALTMNFLVLLEDGGMMHPFNVEVKSSFISYKYRVLTNCATGATSPLLFLKKFLKDLTYLLLSQSSSAETLTQRERSFSQ